MTTQPGDASSTLSHSDGRPRRSGGKALKPHLYLALECDRPLAAPVRHALDDVDAVSIGRGAERAAARTLEDGTRRLAVRVPDRWMSQAHARLLKVFGRWMLEDAGSKNGTLLNGTAQKRSVLADGDVIELGHTLFLFRDAVPTEEDDPVDLDAARLAPAAAGLATLSPPLARTFAALVQISASPVSVVLHGESGTGKEVVARAIHELSGRAGAFVAVNCGALPDTLVESELYGHKKGAFSGALEDRPGLVRSADRGTLFLDEIGDLPLPAQAAFLRVLQEREVMPVGATRPVPVDFRLVAATHRDLEALADKGDFRPDLLARISGFTVTLPPLRARREDLGLLVGALLRRLAPEKAAQVTLACDAARALHRHAWPLNIRELEKVLGAAVVLAQAAGHHVELAHLPPAVAAALEARPAAGADDPTDRDPTEDTTRPMSPVDAQRKAELVALLAEHGGNISAVARAMGKARMQIQRWVKRFGIDPESYRAR